MPKTAARECRISNSSTRWLIGAGAAAAVLAGVSVLAAVLGGAGADTFPEDTPEGVVQRYLHAIQDDDYQTAYGYLSAETQAACPLRAFRDTVRRSADHDRRVLLERTEVLDGQTLVAVRIARIRSEPPFPPSEYSFREEYALERENGGWRFTGPAWPLGACRAAQPTPAPAGSS